MRLRLWLAFCGLLLCTVLAFSRSERLFEALWEDEAHYHYKAFEAVSLRDLRYDTKEVFKPFLDFALRRYAWFSPWGFKVTELSLGLVSLLQSWGHLLLWMFLPWTRSWPLRFMAVLLLGSCQVEIDNSTDAQGYSFFSLGSSLVFLGYWGSHALLEKGRPGAALGLAVFWLFFGLNTHFFLWPVMAALAALLFWRLSKEASPAFLALSALCLLAAVAAALLANRPSLEHLLQHPPQASHALRFAWREAAAKLPQAWTWLGLSGWAYALLAFAGFWHRSAPKRKLWRAAFIALFPLKFALIALMLAKSDYPVADRYLIMYLAPSLIVLGLGAESLLSRLPKERILALLLLLALLSAQAEALVQKGGEAAEGLARLSASPGDVSPTQRLFERAKAPGDPLLVLGNHPWATDLPLLYLKHLGRKPTAELQVLDSTGRYETPLPELKKGLAAFKQRHSKDGVLLYFFDVPQGSMLPCPPAGHFLTRDPALPCSGLLKQEKNAGTLASALKGLPHE